ncbi:STAS domain-containing protein [Streptomyces sp. NK15101]|uniref:STAS domain-containing protein n=1 Tax=Streptomyces sp. NK15101 TaxID=2873261 RepID=UPI001CEDDB89|nr:STAS domain-containing protein [Streptomyces sp. NK15101]
MEAVGRTEGARASREDRLLVVSRHGGPPGTVLLALDGELDHDTVRPLRKALEESTGAVRVVVDCARLRFCDSTGLNVLLRTRLRLLTAGGRVDLAGLRSPVRRIFEITGALKVFRVYADADAALADTGAGS